jgi:hypothetical protein
MLTAQTLDCPIFLGDWRTQKPTSKKEKNNRPQAIVKKTASSFANLEGPLGRGFPGFFSLFCPVAQHAKSKPEAR